MKYTTDWFNEKYEGKTITATELPAMTDDLCAVLLQKHIFKPMSEKLERSVGMLIESLHEKKTKNQ